MAKQWRYSTVPVFVMSRRGGKKKRCVESRGHFAGDSSLLSSYRGDALERAFDADWFCKRPSFGEGAGIVGVTSFQRS